MVLPDLKLSFPDYTELVPDVLMHYISERELHHLELHSDAPYQFAGIIIDVLDLLDELDYPYDL